MIYINKNTNNNKDLLAFALALLGQVDANVVLVVGDDLVNNSNMNNNDYYL